MSNAIRLIARREITSRVQHRSYRISFGITLVVVVLACVVPAFFGGDDKPASYDVAVSSRTGGLPAALVAVGKAEGIVVHVHRAAADVARAKVHSGDWDAAVLPGNTLLTEKKSDGVVAVVQDSYQLAETVGRLHSAGLTRQQATHALNVAPLRTATTSSPQSTQRQTIAIIAVVLLFSQLVTFCTWVAMGVVEEKASRVVELVLSSVRPAQLLTGKLLGIGVLAAVQVLALGAVALVAATAAGTLTVPASGLLTALVSFVGFVLGYAFFAALAAGLASTVSRQEELSGILAPVTLTLTVCYAVSFATATNPDTTFARVLSVVPPVSAISMPARIAHGGVPVLDVVLAVVLLLISSAGIIAVAARVYRASVLHSGTRVPLRRAWRGEAVSAVADVA